VFRGTHERLSESISTTPRTDFVLSIRGSLSRLGIDKDQCKETHGIALILDVVEEWFSIEQLGN
jgi:hypothetical protein